MAETFDLVFGGLDEDRIKRAKGFMKDLDLEALGSLAFERSTSPTVQKAALELFQEKGGKVPESGIFLPTPAAKQRAQTVATAAESGVPGLSFGAEDVLSEPLQKKAPFDLRIGTTPFAEFFGVPQAISPNLIPEDVGISEFGRALVGPLVGPTVPTPAPAAPTTPVAPVPAQPTQLEQILKMLGGTGIGAQAAQLPEISLPPRAPAPVVEAPAPLPPLDRSGIIAALDAARPTKPEGEGGLMTLLRILGGAGQAISGAREAELAGGPAAALLSLLGSGAAGFVGAKDREQVRQDRFKEAQQRFGLAEAGARTGLEQADTARMVSDREVQLNTALANQRAEIARLEGEGADQRTLLDAKLKLQQIQQQGEALKVEKQALILRALLGARQLEPTLELGGVKGPLSGFGGVEFGTAARSLITGKFQTEFPAVFKELKKQAIQDNAKASGDPKELQAALLPLISGWLAQHPEAAAALR